MSEKDEREALARMLAPDAWTLTGDEWLDEHGDATHSLSWCAGAQGRAREMSLRKADVIVSAGSHRDPQPTEDDPSDVLNAATVEARDRYASRLVEDYDGDRYTEDEYGYDATARQAFVAGALWQAGVVADQEGENDG